MKTQTSAMATAVGMLAIGCGSPSLSLEKLATSPDATESTAVADAGPSASSDSKPKKAQNIPHYRGEVSFGCSPNDGISLILTLYAFGEPCSNTDEHQVAFRFALYDIPAYLGVPRTFQIGSGEGLDWGRTEYCPESGNTCTAVKSTTKLIVETHGPEFGVSGHFTVQLESGEEKSATFETQWCKDSQSPTCG